MRRLRVKVREAKTSFTLNYLRNSDSKALLSSKFKEIAPTHVNMKLTHT